MNNRDIRDESSNSQLDQLPESLMGEKRFETFQARFDGTSLWNQYLGSH
jgi:hypothetical protein